MDARVTLVVDERAVVGQPLQDQAGRSAVSSSTRRQPLPTGMRRLLATAIAYPTPRVWRGAAQGRVGAVDLLAGEPAFGHCGVQRGGDHPGGQRRFVAKATSAGTPAAAHRSGSSPTPGGQVQRSIRVCPVGVA
jgi:hypothetical protein